MEIFFLLWAVLNLGLLIFFIVICLKATKFIREKLGLFSSIIFVFGLLSFMINGNTEDKKKAIQSNTVNGWNYNSKNDVKPNTTRTSIIQIDKGLFSYINLIVQYGAENKSNNDIAIYANSTTTGLVIGHEWKVENIYIDTTNIPDKLKYVVNGTMEWKLIGNLTYSQPKTLTGIFETNK